jgi:hypothetical protein
MSLETTAEMRSSLEDQILENTLREKDYEESIVKEIRHDFCGDTGHPETLHSSFHVKESTMPLPDLEEVAEIRPSKHRIPNESVEKRTESQEAANSLSVEIENDNSLNFPPQQYNGLDWRGARTETVRSDDVFPHVKVEHSANFPPNSQMDQLEPGEYENGFDREARTSVHTFPLNGFDSDIKVLQDGRLDSCYSYSTKCSEHHAQYTHGRDVIWDRGRAFEAGEYSYQLDPLNSNVFRPETRVNTDPVDNAMANLYYECEFEDSPLPNGIPSFVLARVKRTETNRSYQLPLSNETESFTAENSERDKIFVNHPNVSIFGDAYGDLVDATNLNASIGQKLYSWMCCGATELVPVADGLPILGSNSNPTSRPTDAAVTSERPVFVEARGQTAGDRYSSKARPVETQAGQRTDGIIDTIIVVGQSSNASAFALDDVGDMQTREYMSDQYMRPTGVDDTGNDWSGRYDEVMTRFHNNEEHGQTNNLNGFIDFAVDARDEASVFHDSLEEGRARDMCTQYSTNSSEL